MAVIGVGRFIQQRQDFEDEIARSYQVEMRARVQAASSEAPGAARATVVSQVARRDELQSQISDDTRDTAILVAAGLIAGLTGALLLFSGLIASLRRPLEDLVDAAGRLAGGDLSTRVEAGGLSETATLGAAFNEMAGQLETEAGEREKLDRLKDEFVLTASHELRSPLTSVQGFAELLMLERDSLTPKQLETVEIILDNCRHLGRLLNDLLDLTRSDAGRLALRREPTELAPLIEEVARTMRAQTDRAGQSLSVRLEPNLPLVDAAPDRIRQILVNLITNAHEYSPERASVDLSARVRCRCGDCGDRRRPGDPGGPAGADLRALHPRRRGPDPARRRHRPRPGDLEIAGRAPRRLDQRRIDARKGLELPLHPAGEQLMARVLVADDSETILLLMRTRLELAGHDVATAADGQEVTEIVAASDPGSSPEVLLLDAMMPRKSGIDALRELRAAGVETPALIVSAHQDPNDADAATDVEISGYVTKPIDFDRLLDEIAALTS